MLGVTGREFERARNTLGERFRSLEWLRRNLQEAGEGGMRFRASWWILGGSLVVLGVTGRDLRRPRGAGKREGIGKQPLE